MSNPYLPLDNKCGGKFYQTLRTREAQLALRGRSTRRAKPPRSSIPWWRAPRRAGLNPGDYLQALFERYPFAITVEERRQLLPMFIKNVARTG